MLVIIMSMKTLKYLFFTTLFSILCLVGCNFGVGDGNKPETPPAPVLPDENSCITFKSIDSFNLNVLKNYWNGELEYSTNGSTWYPLSKQTVSADKISSEYYVFLRGKGNTSFFQEGNSGLNYSQFILGGSSKAVECSGNIMTLLDYTDPNNAVMDDYCFYKLFSNCRYLVKAPDLPSQTLSPYCYANMFEECRQLKVAPKLPAKTLKEFCYFHMFENCTNLETVPSFEATTVANNCCERMFSGCVKLVSIPEVLPATTLAAACYASMFEYCGLKKAPRLPATIIPPSAYHGMFQQCNSLESAPDLPAKEIDQYGYAQMFLNCSSLKTMPNMAAESIGNFGCNGMFLGCTELVNLPDEFTAKTLNTSALSYMFWGCTKITTVSKIHATEIFGSCFEGMFYECASLKIRETSSVTANTFLENVTDSVMTYYKNMFTGTAGTTTTLESGKSYEWYIE